jgi:hypothetical protein
MGAAIHVRPHPERHLYDAIPPGYAGSGCRDVHQERAKSGSAALVHEMISLLRRVRARWCGERAGRDSCRFGAAMVRLVLRALHVQIVLFWR